MKIEQTIYKIKENNSKKDHLSTKSYYNMQSISRECLKKFWKIFPRSKEKKIFIKIYLEMLRFREYSKKLGIIKTEKQKMEVISNTYNSIFRDVFIFPIELKKLIKILSKVVVT